MKNEWNDILQLEKSSPYVFRTRLERVINKTKKYANKIADSELELLCDRISEKLCYISDQSNQTSDGCLNSFILLKSDIMNVRDMVNI